MRNSSHVIRHLFVSFSCTRSSHEPTPEVTEPLYALAIHLLPRLWSPLKKQLGPGWLKYPHSWRLHLSNLVHNIVIAIAKANGLPQRITAHPHLDDRLLEPPVFAVLQHTALPTAPLATGEPFWFP
jgi:hypothetical protein